MGQGTLAGAVDFAARDAAMVSLSCTELSRGAVHAAQLRGALQLDQAHAAMGWEIATVSQIALALGCSENRAARLLSEARALVVLPGAIEAVECGLLTVEQTSTVIEQLAVLDPPDRVVVWQRLQARLTDAADGTVAPPARLAELLGRWVRAQDAEAVTRRRKQAERSRGVDYRRQADGLVDLFARGLNGPDAQAILSRIAARSRPWGSQDDRTADQRRLDAFRDLLLGRDQLPLVADDTPLDAEVTPCRGGLRSAGAAPCGCLPGQPVPCGAEIAVLMPHGAGLGTTDEVAELVGHGPLDPDLLGELLLAGARLRPVWTDEHGVVVAVGDKTIRLQRGDPAAVRAALLELQDLAPPHPQPRHPMDHRAADPPPERSGDDQRTQEQFAAASGLRSVLPAARPPVADGRVLGIAALGGTALTTSGAHPPGTSGGYRPPRWLRRLITLRAPRCEWPGCGARAVRCDAEHDRAWTGDGSGGPTCACNLGPCCRRHHRIKQLGFRKTRSRSGVTWTDPAGRSWHSPTQHEPPATPKRTPRPIPTPHPLDELSPDDLDEELWHLGLLPDDPGPWTTPVDHEPEDTDPSGRIVDTDTRWTLDLDDPYPWRPALV